MTTARARHYPQPPPVAEVLGGSRCEHGAAEGRCPLCPKVAEPDADQAPSQPAKRRLARRCTVGDTDQPAVQPELFPPEGAQR
jgi:hypothetical protein